MKQRNLILAGAALLLVAAGAVIFLNSQAPATLPTLPRGINNNSVVPTGSIVINGDTNGDLSSGGSAAIPLKDKQDAPIVNPLDAARVKSVVQKFIRQYYSYNAGNAASYYDRLASYTTTSALESVRNGEPSPGAGALTKDSQGTLYTITSFTLVSIKGISITQNTTNEASVEAESVYDFAPLEYDTTPTVSTVSADEKLYVHVNSNYKVDIVSLISTVSNNP